MKVLLINPPYINFEGMKDSGGHAIPFNLAYLAGYLRDKIDCQIKILDTEVMALDYDGIRKAIKKEGQQDVIGFTCPSPTVKHVFKISEMIKEDLGFNPVIVVGGTHPTILPKEMLKNPHIDIAAIGEGEITFYEIVNAVKEKRDDFENINGIYYKKGGQILKTPPRDLIPDLDDIPFPARDLFNLKMHYSAPTKVVSSELSSPIFTSRGCAFDCIHCVSKSVWKRKVRYRSARNIIAEIEECINKHNIKEFNILDENFTLNKSRCLEVCQEIINKKLPIYWVCFSRADTIDDEVASIMAKAGCRKISFGLESGSQKILDLMRKQNTVEQGRKAIATARKYGIQPHASFMFGNIGETKETIRETIDYAKSLDLDISTFFITCPVPGSDLYYYAKDNGFIPEGTPWEMFAPLTDREPIPVQRNLSQEELVYWQKKAFREFYLRPKYVIQRLKQLKSKNALKITLAGFKVLLRIFFKPKPKNDQR